MKADTSNSLGSLFDSKEAITVNPNTLYKIVLFRLWSYKRQDPFIFAEFCGRPAAAASAIEASDSSASKSAGKLLTGHVEKRSWTEIDLTCLSLNHHRSTFPRTSVNVKRKWCLPWLFVLQRYKDLPAHYLLTGSMTICFNYKQVCRARD